MRSAPVPALATPMQLLLQPGAATEHSLGWERWAVTAWGISGHTGSASSTLGVPRMSLWCPQGSHSGFGTHSFLATDFQLDLLLSQLLPLGVIFGQGCPLLLHLLLPLFLCRKGNKFKGFPGSFPINTGSQGQKVKTLSQTTISQLLGRNWQAELRGKQG